MAVETANQKRKRGRPSLAAIAANANANAQPRDEGASTLPKNTARAASASNVADHPTPRKHTRAATAAAAATSPAQMPPPKRKRGRPSLQATTSESQIPSDRFEPPSNTVSRRVGRPRKSADSATAETPDGPTQTSQRPGRPRKDADEDAPRKKMGRPRKSVVSPDGDAANETHVPRRGGRPRKSLQPANTIGDEADDENDEAKGLRRSSRRLSGAATSESAHAKPGATTSAQTGPLVEVSVEIHEATSQLRGRPKKGTQPQQATPAESSAQGAARGKRKQPPEPEPERPKKRGRPSLQTTRASPKKPKRKTANEDHAQDAAQEQEPAPAPKRRKRASRTPPASASDDEPPPFQHITTLTRRVPHSTIQKKWSPLDQASIAGITGLLQAASRPVLLRLTNAQRHAHAQTALASVVRRLRSKLSRGMPFPAPAAGSSSSSAGLSRAREAELSYERTVGGISALEAQLDPLLHSTDLLRRELDRAHRALERDYRALHRLGANARAEARERRDQLRRVHALVPEPRPRDDDDDDHANPAVVAPDQDPETVAPGAVFADLLAQQEARDGAAPHATDAELLGLAAQLSSHVHSVHANLRQVDGVGPAIERARGALLARLQPRMIERVLA